MKHSARCLLALVVLAGGAHAQSNVRPAARVHVRMVDGAPVRFTSKLSEVVEMDFTLGFSHTESRLIVDRMLDRIAADYGQGGAPAFKVKKFASPEGGARGLPKPLFTLEDLMAADVIVTNNIGSLNLLPRTSPEAAAAIETAVKAGRGILGFHGSGEVFTSEWEFLAEKLFPFDFQGHGGFMATAPVYRNEAEERHIVLEGILDSVATRMEAPMGLDSNGIEILKPDVPARLILNEMNQFARNILTDERYAPLSTCLLRFDPRHIFSGNMPDQYKNRGGNAYVTILEAGAGKSVFIPAGHDASELTEGQSSFDGGTGDFERFYAQMLFYLAGYKQEPCGGAVDCTGLPLVDSQDHLIGEVHAPGTGISRREEPRFQAPVGQTYQAILTDLGGRIVATRSGQGAGEPSFAQAGLPPGLYFLSVLIGKGPARTQRYFLPPTPR